MSEQLTAWIRRVAALNDVDLEEELSLINKNSLNAFARALSRIRRPELDSHSYRNGTYEAHPHADTINLLLSILFYVVCYQFRNSSQPCALWSQSAYGCQRSHQGLNQTNYYIQVGAPEQESCEWTDATIFADKAVYRTRFICS
jgi:hypothetical protein